MKVIYANVTDITKKTIDKKIISALILSLRTIRELQIMLETTKKFFAPLSYFLDNCF